ncbi:MAG TPA: hypothetical protein VHW02_11535 [Rhizomicrobium sp.]|nr:hypothetical protein [Rhizomicrobium sp.]
MSVAAAFCAAAGLTFGVPEGMNPFDGSHLWGLTAYALLTFPYFYSRYLSLEGPSQEDNRVDATIFIPLLFLVIALMSIWFTRDYLFQFSGWKFVALALSIAGGTFFYLWARMYYRLTLGDDVATEERLFKNRVLIPAFSTCLVSFTYGWILANSDDWWVIAIPLALTIAGRELLAAQKWTIAVFGMTASIFGFSLFSVLNNSAIGKVLVVGIILTMAMGVAEVCKRAVWIKLNKPFIGDVIDGEDANYYLAGANYSSTVFPLLLCLLPLLIPALSVTPIFVVLSFQYLHWHFIFVNKSSRWISGLNVVLGFALPAVLIAAHFIHVPKVNDYPKGLFIDVIGFTALFVAAIGVMAAPWSVKFHKFLQLVDQRKLYLHPVECFCLFLLIAFGIILFIMYLSLWVGEGTYLEPKAKETILYLLGLIATTGVLFWWRYVRISTDPRPR